MASDDVYLRKDVYAADQRAIIAEMQRGNAEVLRVLEQFRSENKEAINQFKGEVNSRFDKLESQVTVLTGRVDGLERRIGSLENFVTAGISFIAMLIALAVFIVPVSRFIRRFWKPKPTITLEQVEALIDAKLSPKQ